MQYPGLGLGWARVPNLLHSYNNRLSSVFLGSGSASLEQPVEVWGTLGTFLSRGSFLRSRRGLSLGTLHVSKELTDLTGN